MERTLVILKPDAVQRRLVGRIISLFEDAKMEILRMHMREASRSLIAEHYPDEAEFVNRLGKKTSAAHEAAGTSPEDVFGTCDIEQIGATIRQWLIDYLCSGPVVALVLSGPDAVSGVRELVGATMPDDAEPGTIRGDLASDTALAACSQGRAVYNLIHASGSVEEAEKEIALWFPDAAQ